MDILTFKLATGTSFDTSKRWAPIVSAAMEEFGVVTDRRMAAFLAQVGHESGGFSQTAESFNYSIAGLGAIFGKRLTPVQCQQLGRRPNEKTVPLDRQEQIANLVYGGRYGNGDASTGDGWRYRGRGLKQVTFKDNYRACGAALGVDLISSPELLQTDDLAARSAAWFWHANGCNQFADSGDFNGLTGRINGGLNGLEDRVKRWELAKRALGIRDS